MTHTVYCSSVKGIICCLHDASVCLTTHLQEGEVSGVLHHGDLKVAHYDLTAGVPPLHQVVLDL